MKKYARFDEIENVLASLAMMAALSPLVIRKRGESYWKWIIVGAHDAVQGAIVCAIADSTGTSVLNKKSARAMLDFLEGATSQYPGEFMADFRTLLKRAKVGLSRQEANDIKKLHAFRNDFMHFTPQSWSIETAGLRRIIGVALRVVEELMKSDKIAHRLSGNRKRAIRDRLKSIRDNLGSQ